MAIVTTDTESYTVDWDELANRVEALVMAKLKNDLEHWAGVGHLGMRAMFLQDAADGLAVCEVMLDKKSWHTVENRLRDMDTAARDCVYDMIEEVAGEDFFNIVRG